MMNPIPMCGQETTHTSDPSGNVHTCPGGTPANWTNFPYPAAGTSHITSFTIGDSLRIPESVSPGEYVLQWRWDSEQTPQVSKPSPIGSVLCALMLVRWV